MVATFGSGAVEYRQFGSGPVVFFLQGSNGDGKLRQESVDDLVRAGFRVVVPDLHGHRTESNQPGGFSLDECCARIVGLMKYLGIGRAAFVGVALGGQVLLRLMEEHPARVAAACISAVGLKGQGPSSRLLHYAGPAMLIGGSRDHVFPAQNMRAIAEKMPNGSFVLIRHAGHRVDTERPELFRLNVKEFLTAILPRRRARDRWRRVA